MAAEDQSGAGGEGAREGDQEGAAAPASGAPSEVAGSKAAAGWRSPLFEAQHADRYDRQSLIREYESTFKCRLVVVIDLIFDDSVPLFEELVFDADPLVDMHVLLVSPGGNGETAVRLVRAAQQRCRELTIVVPDQAKSAATILAMGAHRILMGPTSDLGPVDAQVPVSGHSTTWVAAKDLIAAVERAEAAVAENPESYPLHVALLSDVNALTVQQARSALERTADLVEEALKSNPDRKEDEVNALKDTLNETFVERPRSHAAIVDADAAGRAGLPVVKCDPASPQWRLIWALWARYLMIGGGQAVRIYEGRRASFIRPIADQ